MVVQSSIDPSIQPVFKSSNKLHQSLVHVKTPVTTERKRRVVYCIPCKDCEYVHIGETG